MARCAPYYMTALPLRDVQSSLVSCTALARQESGTSAPAERRASTGDLERPAVDVAALVDGDAAERGTTAPAW
jgi:hypothetical protein